MRIQIIETNGVALPPHPEVGSAASQDRLGQEAGNQTVWLRCHVWVQQIQVVSDWLQGLQPSEDIQMGFAPSWWTNSSPRLDLVHGWWYRRSSHAYVPKLPRTKRCWGWDLQGGTRSGHWGDTLLMARFLRKYEGGQTIVAAYSGICHWIFHGIYPPRIKFGKIWVGKFRCFISPSSNKSKRFLLQ